MSDTQKPQPDDELEQLLPQYPEPKQRYSGGIWLGDRQLHHYVDVEKARSDYELRNHERHLCKQAIRTKHISREEYERELIEARLDEIGRTMKSKAHSATILGDLLRRKTDLRRELGLEGDQKEPDDIFDQVVAECIMTNYMHAKASFDNARDAREMLDAANQNVLVLQRLLRYRLAENVEQMLVERVEKTLQDGSTHIKFGSKWYSLTEEVT